MSIENNQPDKDPESILFLHVDKKHSSNETHALAIPNSGVVVTESLQNIEKKLLAKPTTILEEDVFGKGTIDVTIDLLGVG